jgi:peroxiredoxin
MSSFSRSGVLPLPLFSLLVSGVFAFASSAQAGDQAQAGGSSASAQSAQGAQSAPSTPVEVGSPAPDFTLKDTGGGEHRLSGYLAEGKVVVLEWFNPDCPFVRRHHERDKTMSHLNGEYAGKGVVWLAVNSGAPGKQGAGQERNVQARKEYQIAYPVLLDESGMVGRMYGAKTTPHMFVIRPDGILAYAGGIDDDPRGTNEKRTNYVAQALSSCLAGKPVATAHSDSYGCSVKYGTAL